jgi:hypothetical protein
MYSPRWGRERGNEQKCEMATHTALRADSAFINHIVTRARSELPHQGEDEAR